MSGNGEIRITTFDPAYAKAFADLNYQWIEQYFAVEQQDREMLDEPGANIIEAGGEIFFAVVDDAAVGTAALLNTSDESFELAKMAVSPEHRGRGIGDRLIEAAIAHARSKGKQRVDLLSNSVLEPALALYRKHGFVEMPLDGTSPYERTNIRMQLALNSTRM